MGRYRRQYTHQQSPVDGEWPDSRIVCLDVCKLCALDNFSIMAMSEENVKFEGSSRNREKISDRINFFCA
jgi:hypothetical protein